MAMATRVGGGVQEETVASCWNAVCFVLVIITDGFRVPGVAQTRGPFLGEECTPHCIKELCLGSSH